MKTRHYLYILFGLVLLFSTYYAYNTKITNSDKIAETQKVEGQAPNKLEDNNQNNNTNTQPNGIDKKEIFSDTASGKSIKKIIELYSDLDAPDSANGKIAHAEIQKLYDTPNQAFEEIKSGALSIPQEQEMQKQFLLQFSSLLGVDKNDKLLFLDKAFKETVNTATNSVNFQTRRTPVIVFETYCRTAEDKELCGKLINESIASAPKDVQIPLLNAYNNFDPEASKELTKKIGINTY